MQYLPRLRSRAISEGSSATLRRARSSPLVRWALINRTIHRELDVSEKQTNIQSANQRGGKRTGAGRKKGEPNKRTAEAIAVAEATGITPLEYLLDVMRNSGDGKMRMSAAIAAAPYVHAKLSAVEVTGSEGGPVLNEIVIRMVDANHG